MLSLFLLKQSNGGLMSGCYRTVFGVTSARDLQTISAPFSSAALNTVFNSGSRKSSSAKLKVLSSCHSAPGTGWEDYSFKA